MSCVNHLTYLLYVNSRHLRQYTSSTILLSPLGFTSPRLLPCNSLSKMLLFLWFLWSWEKTFLVILDINAQDLHWCIYSLHTYSSQHFHQRFSRLHSDACHIFRQPCVSAVMQFLSACLVVFKHFMKHFTLYYYASYTKRHLCRTIKPV